MSYPATPDGSSRKCKLCHERDRYFNATLNEWLPYCDRECARRASELYTVDPAVLCVCCRQRPRFIDYETGIVHAFCSESCEKVYMPVDDPTAGPDEDGLYARTEEVTPRDVYTDASSRSSHPFATTSSPKTIYFDEKTRPYYFLTNLSPHAVEWKGRIYPTAEHLFQAFKFIHQYPDIAEEIRLCSRPSEALSKARQYQDYRRSDWFSVNIQTMRFVLKLKFRQHKGIWRQLLETGDAKPVEASWGRDDFWGNGADNQGQNWLGVLLMELRDKYTAKL